MLKIDGKVDDIYKIIFHHELEEATRKGWSLVAILPSGHLESREDTEAVPNSGYNSTLSVTRNYVVNHIECLMKQEAASAIALADETLYQVTEKANELEKVLLERAQHITKLQAHANAQQKKLLSQEETIKTYRDKNQVLVAECDRQHYLLEGLREALGTIRFNELTQGIPGK